MSEYMKIELSKESLETEVYNIEQLIKQFDITGHIAVMDNNKIYFVIDKLQKKYYV